MREAMRPLDSRNLFKNFLTFPLSSSAVLKVKRRQEELNEENLHTDASTEREAHSSDRFTRGGGAPYIGG